MSLSQLCNGTNRFLVCFLKFFLFLVFIYLVALGLSCSRQAPYLRQAGSLVVAGGLLS